MREHRLLSQIQFFASFSHVFVDWFDEVIWALYDGSIVGAKQPAVILQGQQYDASSPHRFTNRLLNSTSRVLKSLWLALGVFWNWVLTKAAPLKAEVGT